MRVKSKQSAPARPRWCTKVDQDQPAVERVDRLLRDPRIRRASELPALDRCPDCGSKVYDKPLGTVAAYARRECGSCGRRLGHVAADPRRALEWARELKIRTGRFRGRTCGELARTAAGLDLLRWAAEGAGPDLRRAARIVLANLGEKEEDTDIGCPRCGSRGTRAVRLVGGPHFAKQVCVGCGRVVRFLPKPR